MIGKCLCGEIQFEIKGETPNLLQCHCSLCRKQSGSSANAATFVHESKFAWKSGMDKVTYFKNDTGFSSNFCSICGSPVPNQLRDTDKYWIPAGLLEDDLIQSVDGRAVATFVEFAEIIRNGNGNTISIEIERSGEVFDVDATPQAEFVEGPDGGETVAFQVTKAGTVDS